MGLRFQRRIRIAPGLHLNLSGSGVGFSAGRLGFHVGIDARRRPYFSAGIPGTGLSVREYGKPAPESESGSGFVRGVLWALLLVLLIALVGGFFSRAS